MEFLIGTLCYNQLTLKSFTQSVDVPDFYSEPSLILTSQVRSENFTSNGNAESFDDKVQARVVDVVPVRVFSDLQIFHCLQPGQQQQKVVCWSSSALWTAPSRLLTLEFRHCCAPAGRLSITLRSELWPHSCKGASDRGWQRVWGLEGLNRMMEETFSAFVSFVKGSVEERRPEALTFQNPARW